MKKGGFFLGMYDCLGGEQVKIFYRPIFQLNKQAPEDSSYWWSGGSLNSYDEEDELPLKTLWYQYPENFMVYDYRWDYEDVWIIRNGKFNCLMSYKKLTEKEMVGIEAVYDYHGNPINIQTVSDFSKIKNAFARRMEEVRQVEKAFFPKGSIQTIKENLEEFESKKEAYYKELDAVNEKYANRWLVPDHHGKETDFGALLDCYIYWRGEKENEPLKDIIVPKREYEGCKLTLKKMIEDHPELIEWYKLWLNEPSMLEDIGFDEIVKEILQEE